MENSRLAKLFCSMILFGSKDPQSRLAGTHLDSLELVEPYAPTWTTEKVRQQMKGLFYNEPYDGRQIPDVANLPEAILCALDIAIIKSMTIHYINMQADMLALEWLVDNVKQGYSIPVDTELEIEVAERIFVGLLAKVKRFFLFPQQEVVKVSVAGALHRLAERVNCATEEETLENWVWLANPVFYSRDLQEAEVVT